jgi:hypothetical protein
MEAGIQSGGCNRNGGVGKTMTAIPDEAWLSAGPNTHDK